MALYGPAGFALGDRVERERVVRGRGAGGSASLPEVYAKHSVPPGAGFYVGRDVGLPVSDDYTPPFEF